ncbi:Uncharacterised protein [Salmonella enterica subsp. enterica]|uniref:Uncharacterized protein n=1 Tax=Salmonella enterica I TaxID=59201 RepID=A0A3S4HXP6_SALET|nr:Uncharacterised protein [Salmonella enterica subsp. enterica]
MFTAIDNILNSTQLSGEAYFVAEHQGQLDIFRVALEPGAETEINTVFQSIT